MRKENLLKKTKALEILPDLLVEGYLICPSVCCLRGDHGMQCIGCFVIRDFIYH